MNFYRKSKTMNLTEPQIEAVFEWIDLNVDRKTAIRFVKDFYKPKFEDKTDESKTIVDKTQGEFTSTNSIHETHIVNDVGSDRLMELSLFLEGWSKENILKIQDYKPGLTVESFSYPGEKIRIGTDPVIRGNKLISMWSLNERGDYRTNVILVEQNFNGTGNTYWATIVK